MQLVTKTHGYVDGKSVLFYDFNLYHWCQHCSGGNDVEGGPTKGSYPTVLQLATSVTIGADQVIGAILVSVRPSQ